MYSDSGEKRKSGRTRPNTELIRPGQADSRNHLKVERENDIHTDVEYFPYYTGTDSEIYNQINCLLHISVTDRVDKR